MLKQKIFSVYADEFFNERISRGRSIETIKFYQRELRYFLEWLAGNYPDLKVEELTPAILRKWFSELAEHRNPGGVRTSYRTIKAFLNFYDFEYEPVWKNPIKKVVVQSNGVKPLPEIP